MRDLVAGLALCVCFLRWVTTGAAGQTNEQYPRPPQSNPWGYNDSALCKFLRSRQSGVRRLYPRVLKYLGLAIAFVFAAGSFADPSQAASAFNPLHIYYISPSGNDANSG